MNYIVKSRELKWQGKTLLRGEAVEAKVDRDHKHIELLAKIGKVEPAPERKPRGHVVTTRAMKADEPEAAAAPAPESDPSPVLTADDLPGAAPRTYRTRRMNAED